MNKSVWYIFIFGILGVFILMMAMCLSLEGLSVSDAGNRVKLAEAIQSKFSFESASAGVGADGVKTVLRVSYRPAAAGATFDLSAQNKEMEAVAAFTAATYSGSDKRSIDEIRVTRTVVRGRGCWKRTDVATLTKNDPFQTAAPFPVRRP